MNEGSGEGFCLTPIPGNGEDGLIIETFHAGTFTTPFHELPVLVLFCRLVLASPVVLRTVSYSVGQTEL